MESKDTPVFISGDELQALIDSDPALVILDCSQPMNPPDGDPILSYQQRHIKG